MTNHPPERTRYPYTTDPVTTDGRDIDIAIASLEGEGAQQKARDIDRHLRRVTPDPWNEVPQTSANDPTYYDRPMLKQSVWGIDIPLYYFCGGAAGAALTLGAAIQFVSPRGEHPLRHVSAVCHWTGIIGSSLGAVFLIHDLGRPSRFLYMMRVFRPSSPMNMGVWILSGAAPAAIVTGLLVKRHGVLGLIGEITGYIAGVFGAALSGYTGVLVANSAVPIWQAARHWLPVLFVASSAASAASVIDVVACEACESGMTRIFGTVGRLGELAAAHMVEQAASAVPRVGEPLRSGGSAMLWKAARNLTAASFAASLLPFKRRKVGMLAGVLGIAGSLCLRLAVHYMTNVSSRDARASFHQQRANQLEDVHSGDMQSLRRDLHDHA